MLDVVLAARDDVRPAVEALGAKLYIGHRPDDAVYPHAWMRAGAEAPSRPILAEFLATIYLDLYARNTGEARIMENAVAFLDDYYAPNYENAIGIRYRFESKTRLAEAQGLEHVTVLYAVTYIDRRKVVMP